MHEGGPLHPYTLTLMTIPPLHPLAIAGRPRPSADSPSVARSDCGNCGQPARETTPDQPVDELSITTEAQTLAAQRLGRRPAAEFAADTEPERDAPEQGVAARSPEKAEPASSQDLLDLSDEELAQLADLRDRDREVRAHEQAHLAAAGPHARGGASFEYQVGPDGQRYAVGGEVSIDTSSVPDDPAATIQKAQQIRAAALAPASPSAQDQRVAAAATQMEAQARAELAELNGAGATLAEDSDAASQDKEAAGAQLDVIV